MIELVPNQTIPLLTKLLRAEPPRAVVLVGAPGMAKTEVVRQAAAQIGATLITEHPLLREPIDYAGLPWVVEGRVRQLPMAFVSQVQTEALDHPEKLVVVFFDDVGQATAATQAALMQFVQARQFAGQKIPSNVRFVLATNRRKDKAGVGGVLAPLTNRLTVLGQTIDPDSWAEWALRAGLPPVLVAYVRFKADCLTDPEKDANRDIEPFCSARSLEACGRYMMGGIEEHAVFAGCIGEGRATELTGFLKVWRDLPDVDEVLAKPSTAKVPAANRPDVMYALIGALACHVDGKRMGALTTYLERMPIEYQTACIKDAQAQKPELRKTKALIDWLLKHQDMLGVGSEKE